MKDILEFIIIVMLICIIANLVTIDCHLGIKNLYCVMVEVENDSQH